MPALPCGVKHMGTLLDFKAKPSYTGLLQIPPAIQHSLLQNLEQRTVYHRTLDHSTAQYSQLQSCKHACSSLL